MEKEIARQENLTEDADSLKNQINAMNHIKADVDDHNRYFLVHVHSLKIFINLKQIIVQYLLIFSAMQILFAVLT